ncbi:MAG: M61 family metallopeptidase [Candidatus Kapabacteria bacterium]|nr:M61 family metallopeptidase [Candidatus Kapabacteria bacterium]
MYSIEQTDKQLLGTSAAIRYHLHFENAHRHVVRVVMEVDVARKGALVLGLPVWIPGSYKIRDYISTLGSFSLTNQNGKALSWHWLSKNRLEVEAEEGMLRVEYMYYAYEKDSTIRSSHVTRNHAFLNLVTCCLYVEGREQEVHHIWFHHNRSLWKNVSTSLSPVKEDFTPDEPLVLGALNYDIVVDSPIEIGNHFVNSFEHQGSVVEVAIAHRGNFNPEWLGERIKTIVETEARIFGGLPFDRYVFIIHLFPGMRGGGLEHARSSVNAMDSWGDTAKLHRLLSLLVHEFLHVWNVKRIRPRELGPFDYNRENYTRMLWLVEGATSYYDDHLTYRCGFYTRADYLRILSKDHLSPFFRQPGRNEATIKDNSFQAWVKLYLPHEDSLNRNVSYYLHGGLVFLCLDLWIIAESKGTKRLDDGFRALWAIYKQRPEMGITEEEFIEAVEKATGVAIRKNLLTWLNGKGDDLPFDEIFARVGLQWKEAAPAEMVKIGEDIPTMPTLPKLFTGLTLKTDAGRLVIAQVEDYSPAFEAGIGADDEIIFVNSSRCTSADEFDVLLAKRGENNASELVISSDTGMVTLPLTPKKMPDFALTVREDASEEEKALLECWLQR